MTGVFSGPLVTCVTRCSANNDWIIGKLAPAGLFDQIQDLIGRIILGIKTTTPFDLYLAPHTSQQRHFAQNIRISTHLWYDIINFIDVLQVFTDIIYGARDKNGNSVWIQTEKDSESARQTPQLPYIWGPMLEERICRALGGAGLGGGFPPSYIEQICLIK